MSWTLDFAVQSLYLCFSLQRRPIYDIFPPAITKEEEKEEDDTDEDDEHDRDRDGDAEEEEVDDSGKFSPSSPPVSAKVAFRSFSFLVPFFAKVPFFLFLSHFLPRCLFAFFLFLSHFLDRFLPRCRGVRSSPSLRRTQARWSSRRRTSGSARNDFTR